MRFDILEKFLEDEVNVGWFFEFGGEDNFDG